jgi:acylphosphatase
VDLPGAGTTNIDGTNITTQDTWGPGIRVAGSLISLQGRVDEAGGGRVQQQGNGFQGTRTKDRTALEIGNLKNGRVSVAINGTDRSLSSLPHAVSFKDSGADQTHVTVQIDRHSVAPYLHATLIEAVAGLASSKRHNVVHEVDGGILYGERTAAELGDAAHSVNLRKFRRQEAWDSTGNRKLFASGTAAADPWKTVDGTSVITPA